MNKKVWACVAFIVLVGNSLLSGSSAFAEVKKDDLKIDEVQAEEKTSIESMANFELESSQSIGVSKSNIEMVGTNEWRSSSIEHRENNEYQYDVYTNDEGTYKHVEITRYIGSNKDVIIPSELDGLPVTVIGVWAFQSAGLNSVIIPEGIVEIHMKAFQKNNLYSVRLPQSLKWMSDQAFATCRISSISMSDNVEMESGLKHFDDQWSTRTFSRKETVTLDKLFEFNGGPISLDDIDIISVSEPTVTFENGEFQIPHKITKFTFTFSSHTKYGSGFYNGKYNVNIKDTPAAPLYIKYLDENGREIHDSQFIKGNVGDSYDVSTEDYKLAIEDYTFKEVQGEVVGTLTDAEKSVIYVYTKNSIKAQDLTVNYQDIEGNKLAESKTISGNVGDSYDVSTEAYKLAITGYTYKEVQGEVKGTLTNEKQSVTYVYTKNPVKAQDLIVNYQDTEGNKLAESKIISGNVGDSYDVSTKAYKLAITGYTYKEVQGEVKGTLTNEKQSVTYVYTKNPVKAQDLIVNYQDTEGNKLAESKIISGNVGDSYDVSTKAYKLAIAGYTYKEVHGEVKGALMNERQSVTYVYTKDSFRGKGQPINYQDIEGDKQIDSVKNVSTKGDLPKTGENKNSVYTIVGILLSLFSIIELRYVKKKV